MPNKTMSEKDLVPMLLSRGDIIAIERGLLIVVPASGKRVPKRWLKDNSVNIVIEILKKTGLEGITYTGYTAGRYGEKLASGVTLQFKSVLSGANIYAIFNAGLTRLRTTKHGLSGEPLPKGHFHLAKGSAFLKFWDKAALPRAASRTDFHRRMGNLKPLVFTGTFHVSKKGKLINDSIEPLKITHAQVMKAYHISDNPVISRGQLSDNSVIRDSDKETLKLYKTTGLEDDATTCRNYYGNKVTSKKVTRENGYPASTSNSDPIHTPYVNPPNHEFNDSSSWLKPLNYPKLG